MNTKIKKLNFTHSFIFFFFCNILSLIFFKFNNLTISPLICLILILVIGVSHGSLDNIKGRKILNILKFKSIIIFYLIYVLIAIIVIILWYLFPTFSLIIFLSISILMFASFFLFSCLF